MTTLFSLPEALFAASNLLVKPFERFLCTFAVDGRHVNLKNSG